MKILQSEGVSYTEQKEEGGLGRGVRNPKQPYNTPNNLIRDGRVNYEVLEEYIGAEPALALRQTIAVLDKTIRKPHTLRGFHSGAYVHRVRLAGALRVRLFEKFKEEIRSNFGPSGLTKYRDAWNWKAHPYGIRDVSVVNPKGDKNYERLENYETKATADKGSKKQNRTASDFEGRWLKAFSGDTPISLDDQDIDWKKVADRIYDHLWTQEILINGEPREKRDRETETGRYPSTGKGLIASRGGAIKNAASDPRIARRDEKKANWSDITAAFYFNEDCRLVVDIYDETLDLLNKGGRVKRNLHGSFIYDHFGSLEKRAGAEKIDRKELWNLHNHVRRYYQQLFKSDRLKQAAFEGDVEHMRKILPHENAQLLRILIGKDENTDMSQIIRLGKLIVHAADLPTEAAKGDLNAAFQERLNRFATSDGQSEIKRNEAFTRIWRHAINLSHNSLSTWLDPKNKLGKKNDIFDKSLSIFVVNNLHPQAFRAHAEILFGNDKIGQLGDDNNNLVSRASLFCPDDDDAAKEIAWGMLRLAAQLRHNVNHFATKNRLLAALKNQVVKVPKELNNTDNRGANEISRIAMSAIENLLAFDRSVQKKALADKLNQVKASAYLEPHQVSQLIVQASSLGDASFPIPRLTNVLKQLSNIVDFAPEGSPELLKPLGDLGGMFGTEGTKNPVFLLKTNLLRLVYGSGFSNWLATIDDDMTQSVLRDIVKAQTFRKETMNKERQRFYAVVENITDELQISGEADLTDILQTITARMARVERLNEGYNPKRTKQRAVSNRIEKFRLELFGNLFAKYLQDEELNWLARFDMQAKPLELFEEIKPEHVKTTGADIAPWHSQFYAFLYLIPVEAAARLRNQFRKTAILEAKGDTSIGNELASNDVEALHELVSLYLLVHDTGFSGTEPIVSEEFNETLYQNEDKFETVYSVENEDHDLSLSGTRRGLRQIMRFGHEGVLTKIFEKHKITDNEVTAFCALRDADGEQAAIKLIANRTRAREAVFRRYEDLQNRDLKPDQKPKIERDIIQKASAYKSAAEIMMAHEFKVRSGRLHDHARLYGLLMKVVGRLLDYTLLWERDVYYAYLGLLARQIGVNNLKLVKSDLKESQYKHNNDAVRDVPIRYGLQLPENVASLLSKKYFNYLGDLTDANLTKARQSDFIFKADVKSGFLSLWNMETGFDFPLNKSVEDLLDANTKPIFDRYFSNSGPMNPKDKAANAAHKAKGQLPHKSYKRLKKRDIRNDFAHYNVLRGKNRATLNLSYLVNPVRSLLGYDRKLKNAVAKSIRKILEEEGVTIKWQLVEDRLKNAEIIPIVETHLADLRKMDGKWVDFVLPKSSPRFTSMVQALFEFGRSGYNSGGGQPSYPDNFLEALHIDGYDITVVAEV